MASIQTKIQEAAPRNNELLRILSENDYAKPALQQQDLYIADLEKEIKDLDKRTQDLENKRKAELKDHEKYRDSVMKRFAYKVGRKQEKFNDKAEKEEREYFDALHEEHKAKELRQSISATLSTAQGHKKELQNAAERHTQAQKDLDRLYDSIFEGPSPDFPEEDSRENQANEALYQYQQLRSLGESQYQVLSILSNAKGKMATARSSLDEARQHSRMDMFGGGMMSDMMERNALAKAEVSIAEVKMLIEQARRFSPELRQLPPVQIAQGSLLSDVMFDNVFTDMEFHEKIKNSQIQVERASQDLNKQVQDMEQRYNQTRQQLDHRIKDLGNARVALQQVRQDAFSKTTGR